MDEEVHGFVADSLPPLTEWEHTKQPFIPNGSDSSAFEGAAFNQKKHHHKHHKRDIGERGYDEEVQQFVKEYIPPLNTRVRSTLPFVPNGSDPSAHEGAAFNQRKHHRRHHKKDVAERGMEEEVHGFVTENLPPLNTWVRSSDPFVPNGSDAKAWDGAAFHQKKHHHHHKHHKRPDVAERNMDEEVHGFVADSLPPLTEWEHTKQPFIPNGSDSSAFEGAALSQNKHRHGDKKRFIGERGYDTDVQQFVWDTIHNPLSSSERDWYAASVPFIPNGSKNQYPAFAQQQDIAERGMDEAWVHPYVSNMDVVLPTANPYIRPYLPYENNGGSNVYAQMDKQGQDIANKEVRPDVYVTVHKMINPVAMGRHQEPRPKAPPADRTWDQGPKPKPAPEPEFKFVKTEEPDEDAQKAKAKKLAKENKAKAKKEKEEKDEEAAKPDEEAAGVVPEKKEAKKPTEEELKKEEDDKKEQEKVAEEAEKKEKEEEEDKAKAKKEAEKVLGKKKSEAEVKEEESAPVEEEKPKKPAAEKKEAAPAEKEALAQVHKKADGDKKEEKKEDAPAEPEKVHILEPHEYKEKADTNTPNIRTTFYGKKDVKKAQI